MVKIGRKRLRTLYLFQTFRVFIKENVYNLFYEKISLTQWRILGFDWKVADSIPKLDH